MSLTLRRKCQCCDFVAFKSKKFRPTQSASAAKRHPREEHQTRPLIGRTGCRWPIREEMTFERANLSISGAELFKRESRNLRSSRVTLERIFKRRTEIKHLRSSWRLILLFLDLGLHRGSLNKIKRRYAKSCKFFFFLFLAYFYSVLIQSIISIFKKDTFRPQRC